MALEPNKYALASIGLVEKIRQKVEEVFEGGSDEEVEEISEEEQESKSIREQFEDLVEIGEERYDGIVERVKEERENISEKIREQLSDVFSQFGLVTKEDVEILDGKVARLQRMAKKISAK